MQGLVVDLPLVLVVRIVGGVLVGGIADRRLVLVGIAGTARRARGDAQRLLVVVIVVPVVVEVVVVVGIADRRLVVLLVVVVARTGDERGPRLAPAMLVERIGRGLHLGGMRRFCPG